MSDSSVFLSLILTFARLLKIIFITTWCKFLIQHNKKNFSCWNNIKKASLKLCKFSIIKIRNKIFPCRLYAEGSMSLLVSLLEILLLLRLKIKFFISTAINTLYWGEWIAFLIYFFGILFVSCWESETLPSLNLINGAAIVMNSF